MQNIPSISGAKKIPVGANIVGRNTSLAAQQPVQASFVPVAKPGTQQQLTQRSMNADLRRPQTGGYGLQKSVVSKEIVIVPPRLTPLAEIPTPTLRELEQEYNDENNLDELCDAHNDLIKVIIEKEEELITSHREHIDQVVDIIKTDMSLL